MSEVAAPAPASAPSSSPASGSVTGSSGPASAPAASGSVPGSAAPAAQVPETPNERKSRVLKLKVDGAEQDFDVDAMPDEKLAYKLQMGEAAQRRMQEAAELKKQFNEIVGWIKQNPVEALKHPVFGLDIQKLMEERLATQYKEQLLPESEREKLALQRQLEEYKTKETQWQDQEHSRQQEVLNRQVEQELVRDFKAALAETGIPQNPTTIAMMAEIAKINLDHGIELSPAQMAQEVRERMGGINKNVVSGLKGEALAKYLGDEVVREVLRYSVERVKGPAAASIPNNSPANIQNLLEEPRQQRKMQSVSAFRKFLRE